MPQAQETTTAQTRTGIPGLDQILAGGLPADRLYLVQGEPGTGKTTLALQFLIAGAQQGEQGLYVSISETAEEVRSVAESHGWDLAGVALMELSAFEQQLMPEAQNTVFHPSEVELQQTTALLLGEVERLKPRRVVFDSVSEMRMLAETSLRYRRQMLALKQFFAGRGCTVLLLDDLTTTPRDLQVQSIVHGVVNLQKLHLEFGEERRRLNVVKMRGQSFWGGNHDYVIVRGGLVVFPRMVAAAHGNVFKRERVSTGVVELDALLGGGLDRGTSTLFLGPAGTGKSTLAVQCALAAVNRGERAAIYAFEESLTMLQQRASALGMDLEGHLESGMLEMKKVHPAQLSPGEFASLIREAVVDRDVRVVVIDSLNGYLYAMPQEEFLTLQLHELLAFLGNQGVLTLLVLSQQGVLGPSMSAPIDVTYLADAVIITRFFEAMGAVKKAVSVLKKRGSAHETTIRELVIRRPGIVVGPPLEQFQGVLTGVPVYQGPAMSILDREGAAVGPGPNG